MKVLKSATNGIATMEVIECDCGYHMGVDTSFLEQVHDAFVNDRPSCPACLAVIDVRELLDMPELEFTIEVRRAGYSSRNIKVSARDVKQARMKALDEAGSHEFSEHDADYETDGWNCKDE